MLGWVFLFEGRIALSEIKSLRVAAISPSPFQCRKHFPESKIRELAKSIERDGLIEPVVVRKNGKGWELIAGERRLRAVREHTDSKTILCRIVEATDLQARRMCAAENLQRQDLSDVESVEAIVEMVDAELIEDSEYAGMGKDSVSRVAKLLGKLDSVRRSEERKSEVKKVAKDLSHKFMGQLESVFSTLPRPVEWRAFYNNDLPLVTKIDPTVRQWAIANNLNKSQTKALDKLKREAPKTFEDLSNNVGDDGTVDTSGVRGFFNADGDTSLREFSARDIKFAATRGNELVHVAHNSGENEWYTPPQYLEAARKVLGKIDLDPASSLVAQNNVKASRFFTITDDGLSQAWKGRVFLNPPYSKDLIERFSLRLTEFYESGNVSSAILLVNNATETQWFQKISPVAACICFPKGRIQYLDKHGKPANTPLQGQAFLYFGGKAEKFIEAFSGFGFVARCK